MGQQRLLTCCGAQVWHTAAGHPAQHISEASQRLGDWGMGFCLLDLLVLNLLLQGKVPGALPPLRRKCEWHGLALYEKKQAGVANMWPAATTRRDCETAHVWELWEVTDSVS